MDGQLHSQQTVAVEEVIGDRGTLVIESVSYAAEDFKKRLQTMSRHEALRSSSFAYSTAACIRDYVTAIMAGKRSPVPVEEAIRNLRVVFAAYESYTQKRVVEVF